MTKRTHISGIDETIRNLNKQVEQIEGVTLKGLVRASIPIRRTAQKLCPVVTGNLKASAYTIASEQSPMEKTSANFKGGQKGKAQSNFQQVLSERNFVIKSMKQPTVEIGFTAVYAARVHENPNAGQTPEEEAYTKTGKKIASTVGQWKFLEEAVKQNENEVLDVIQREAKL